MCAPGSWSRTNDHPIGGLFWLWDPVCSLYCDSRCDNFSCDSYLCVCSQGSSSFAISPLWWELWHVCFWIKGFSLNSCSYCLYSYLSLLIHAVVDCQLPSGLSVFVFIHSSLPLCSYLLSHTHLIKYWANTDYRTTCRLNLGWLSLLLCGGICYLSLAW